MIPLVTSVASVEADVPGVDAVLVVVSRTPLVAFVLVVGVQLLHVFVSPPLLI